MDLGARRLRGPEHSQRRTPSPASAIDLTGTSRRATSSSSRTASADPAILAQADQTTGVGWFNGNDAVALTQGRAAADRRRRSARSASTPAPSGAPASRARRTTRSAARAGSRPATPNGADAFDPAAQWDGFAHEHLRRARRPRLGRRRAAVRHSTSPANGASGGRRRAPTSRSTSPSRSRPQPAGTRSPARRAACTRRRRAAARRATRSTPTPTSARARAAR